MLLEDISMLPKVVVAEDQCSLGPQLFCRNNTFSNQHEFLKVLECNGDDMSCISGAESPSMTGDHRCDIGRKNVSCSSASVNSSLPGGLEKIVDLQQTSCCRAGRHCEVKEGCNGSCRPTKFTKESLQEDAHFSDKSDSCEVSCLREVYTGARSLKGDLSEFCREQEASSFAESNMPKSKVDEDDPGKAVRKYLDQNEDLVSPEVPKVQGPPEQSQQTVNCTDDADLMEDVKVCDICGDAGREDFLAICSKCCDGAEHIYCMRVRLDKVPEGDWMCEECMCQEETEKQKQNKFQKVVSTAQGSSSNELLQNTGNSNANIRICLELDNKVSDVERTGQDKVSPIPHLYAKRAADNLESGSISKRRILETSLGLPRMPAPCSKALCSQNSPQKNLDISKVKPARDISTFGDRSFNCCQENTVSPTFSGSNLHKSQTSPQMSWGVLTKSNSFTIPDSKFKIRATGEDILRRQKFSGETGATDKRKDGIVRRMRKSLSFNNVSSGHSKAALSKIKVLSSNFSHGMDLKSLVHAEEHNLSQRKYEAKVHRPLVSSPTVGSCISEFRIDKKVASHGENMLPCSSGTKCCLKPAQSHGNSNIPSKPTCHPAHEGSKYLNSDHAKSGVIKKRPSCLSNVAGDLSSLTKPDASHELNLHIVTSRGRLGSSSSLNASKHSSSSDVTVHDILPQLQSSYNQAGKAQKTSYFSRARGHIVAGNRRAYSHVCDNISDAAETFHIMTPQTFLDTGGSKELKQSNDRDRGPIFCQPDASSILAIPKLDYIWKGGFEVQSSRRLPSFCYGIQAHLSTCTSPKVPGVVKKFPCKVFLNEVPRLSVWPTQFLENCPKEDSIGVYFFAEDQVSYGGNYRNLMECMINYDLALKGDVDGIDLLIFPSNLLPEKSQRWNKLFFLWGIFSGRRVNNGECMPCSQKKKSIPGLSNVRSDQDLYVRRITGLKDMCSGQSRDNTQQTSSLINPQELPSVSRGTRHGNYERELPSAQQEYIHLQTRFDQQPSTDDARSSCIPIQKQLCKDMQRTLVSLKEHGLPERRQEDYQPSLEASNYDPDCVIWGGSRAHSMEVAENSRARHGSPFLADQVDGILQVGSLAWQVVSSDCKDNLESEFLDLGLSLGVGKTYEKEADNLESEFLDLGLSLGVGKTYEKEALVSPSHWSVDKKNNPSSIAGNKNNDGADGKFSASLELCLTLPCYDIRS